MSYTPFSSRHIGSREHEVTQMLKAVDCSSIDELIDQTIPKSIRLKNKLNLSAPMSEYQYLSHIKKLAGKNKVYKSYIGLGYYNTKVPAVIQRNIFENPGWYTAYTPYQAEISQGRLEALLNFQTMLADLSGMELANASLLDEGTAAAEAMIMFYNLRAKEAKANDANQFFVSEECFSQTIAVLQTRAEPLGIELLIGNHSDFEFSNKVFGALVQYPAKDGEVYDYSEFVERAKSVNAFIGVAADIMSLVMLKSPGSWGADAVVGTTQRFGIPMGFGGPHAAYFATRADYKRYLPGRIIGVSQDIKGKTAFRMALQTREQHIKRDRATSNICTAQVLLAVMAGMYAVYHGPKGLRKIANDLHAFTSSLSKQLEKLGCNIRTKNFFDTIAVDLNGKSADSLLEMAEQYEMNFRKIDDNTVGISLDESTEKEDVAAIMQVFEQFLDKKTNKGEFELLTSLDSNFLRNDSILEHDVFNSYHSETAMMRYIKRLENKDLSLNHSMIPLGSCTMKLNAAAELLPLSWPEFMNIHPFAPKSQCEGYLSILEELASDLSEITGFYKTSLQPNSGAQGEYAGLMVIRAYHLSRGDNHRDVALIPSSAHGTNPASAVMAGMKVVVVKCDDQGNIDLDDLKGKAEKYSDKLSTLMITYPSTHGVFEENVKELNKIVHDHGGQVYMDGANMNAQVGLTNPAVIGADVCHLNLHKTFAIPHGGGGPGMGPIGVAEHLAPFLPGNPKDAPKGENISAVSSAEFGSSLVLLISYGYIKMLGEEGLRKSTQMAILNANYLKARLEESFNILFKGKNNKVAHELILDCRSFKSKKGIEVGDIAKRLIDYGFHAPTVSFPVAGTLMVEPTESENISELDRFVEAMLSIRKEIEELSVGDDNNVLKNAPHTMEELTSDEWDFPYSRKKAAFPLKWLRSNKFWPSVKRVDDAFGDRNLMCSCPPLKDYEEVLVD